MTHLIHKSLVSDPAGLEAAVRSHADELASYHKHMQNVAAGKADPYPAPMAHPIVDACVARIPAAAGQTMFKPDYKIIDFIPAPHGDAVALAARKDELRVEVARMERAAMHAVLPLGKWRFKALQANGAAEKLAALRAKNSGNEKRAQALMVPADLVILNEQTERRKKLDAIQLHHAELEAEIEDLDFKTVNEWTPRTFEGEK